MATEIMGFIESYLEQLENVLRSLPKEPIAKLVTWMAEARTRQRTVFVIGNGGSAATAAHFATDVGKGASLGRPQRFRVLSLTDNAPWITALGNDLEYEDIFVEQLKNFAQPEDLVIAISVSGSSPNVVKAVEWAKEHGCRTVGLVGGQRRTAQRTGGSVHCRTHRALRPGGRCPLGDLSYRQLFLYGASGLIVAYTVGKAFRRRCRCQWSVGLSRCVNTRKRFCRRWENPWFLRSEDHSAAVLPMSVPTSIFTPLPPDYCYDQIRNLTSPRFDFRVLGREAHFIAEREWKGTSTSVHKTTVERLYEQLHLMPVIERVTLWSARKAVISELPEDWGVSRRLQIAPGRR